MARRDYGSGSIYQRGDGHWVGALSHGWTERGTRRRITVIADTQAEAKRRLRRRVRQLEEGEANVSARASVKTWATTWLSMAARAQRPASYNAARSAVRQWVVPTIGHRRLDALTPADVRAVGDAQRDAGLTSSTQRRTHSVLMQLLKAARAEGYAVPARVLEVKPPTASVSDRTNLPVGDAVAMLSAAAERPDGSRWVAAFLQGLRQAEALGLTWDAIDLERGLLTVSWQLQPLPYRVARDRASGFRVPDGYEARQVRGRLHLVRPKSRAGWRVIPLVPWMVSALTAWRTTAPAAPLGLVWYHAAGDPAKLDDAAWYALQRAAGVTHPSGRPYTIHEARHTTATLLMEAGIDQAVITAILGHSAIATSRGYMHVDAAPLAEAMSRVAARLSLG
ncbi:MAG: tyrosine-type recombinase/integrase [Acidimicrobiales bacterium]